MAPHNSHTDFYQDFYSRGQRDVGLRQWRDITARDKGRHVIALWQECFGKTSRPSVVDIGCGEGAVAQNLSEASFFSTLHGYEIAEPAVSAAAGRNIPSTEFYRFDGHRVPVADKTFDLAILSHVVEHVPYPRMLLEEAQRIASHVFVEVPLELTVRTSKDFVPNDVGHINLYNPLLIRQTLQTTGAEVIRERVWCASRENYAYRSGRVRGTAKWALVRASQLIAPASSTRIFVYQGTLLARSNG